jgi:hypothetical protein
MSFSDDVQSGAKANHFPAEEKQGEESSGASLRPCTHQVTWEIVCV